MFIDLYDFNFSEELNKAINDSTNKDNICLISHEPLCECKKITLPCNHSFNYDILIKSLEKNKNYHNIKSYNTDTKYNCPYCRKSSNLLLPYIPELYKKKLYGINYGSREKIKSNVCTFIDNYNKKCEKICINNLCYKHYLKSTKTKKTIKELRLIAKDMKLKKYSRLRKQELIELIEKNKNI